MQFYSVSVQLGGDRNHTVTNKGPVSVAEIAVLRAVHGDASVSDFRYLTTDTKGFDRAEHLEYLRRRYGQATPGEVNRIVDTLFGPHGKLPTSLQAIGIDPKAEAAKLREAAAEAAAAAEKLEAETGAGEGEDDEFSEFLPDEEAA